MLYLGIGLVLLALFYMGSKAFVSANPAALAAAARKIGAFVLGIGGLYMMITGRELPALLILSAAAAVGGRNILPGPLGRIFGGLFGGGSPSPDFSSVGTGANGAKQSVIETPWLAMTLDHDSGALAGTVRQGRFQGRRLADLGQAELMALAAELAGDAQSAALLESYLDRVHPAWRQAGSGPATPPSGQMTPDEARAVLGVGPQATADEIREAHRRLLKKMHPDVGGSDYLAAKINQAKDLLLRH